MNNRKSFFAVFGMLAASLMLPVMITQASAGSTTKYDWYYTGNKEHVLPEPLAEADFIEKYDSIIYGNPNESKKIYLTFDAGYDNGYHTTILKTLKEKGVQGTFFLDGNFLKRNPELVRQMVNEGHIVGNHSLNHPDMTKYTDFEEYKKQLTGWEELYREITGKEPVKLFRFPMGCFSEQSIIFNERLGYKSVFWSFAYYDWDVNKQPSAESAMKKIMDNAHPGGVYLIHSVSKTNDAILGEMIDNMRAQGYEFSSLTDFIG